MEEVEEEVVEEVMEEVEEGAAAGEEAMALVPMSGMIPYRGRSGHLR